MTLIKNRCENCGGFMKVEKNGDNYEVICPECNKEDEEEEL